jgi:hypothetical protein
MLTLLNTLAHNVPVRAREWLSGDEPMLKQYGIVRLLKDVLCVSEFVEIDGAAWRRPSSSTGYVPMLFDFEKPTDKDFTETIMTLAGLSLFIIADITNPKSSPLELQATVPNYMTPFVPIIEEGEVPFSMFKDLQGKFDWILDTLIYDSEANLIRGFEKAILDPALKKHDELMIRKAQDLQTRHIGQYLKDS